MAAGATITCTFTNARRSATLTLEKFWENGAAGDAADLSIDGATSGAGSRPRPRRHPAAPGFPPPRATATVFSGDAVVLAEVFGAGNIGSYDAALTCSDAAGLTYVAGALSGTYTVPAAPTDVVCTVHQHPHLGDVDPAEGVGERRGGRPGGPVDHRLRSGDRGFGRLDGDRRGGFGDRPREPGDRDDLLR